MTQKYKISPDSKNLYLKNLNITPLLHYRSNISRFFAYICQVSHLKTPL